MDAFALAAKLTLDSKGFERDLGKQESVLKKFGGAVAKVASTIAIGTAVKKSIDAVAKEVIAGKWGNGSDRKKRLKAAGYDYAAVQKRVNALLKK